MNVPKLSKRLLAAASLARVGVRIADVGTDHAYLPIYLFTSGRVSGGVVSDINRGPVERARANLCDYGCEGAFAALQTDGLSGIEEYAPEDIFILGMGGELIARIISDAPWVKKAGVRLILQPMTHPELLRDYLSREGFETVRELLVHEDKIYHIICAEYSGKRTELNAFEALFGKDNLSEPSEELYALLTRTREIYSQRVAGKMLSGADSDYENEIIEKIDEFMKKENGK
jgi:tRNA (adenine22-N1)-methyltransferase